MKIRSLTTLAIILLALNAILVDVAGEGPGSVAKLLEAMSLTESQQAQFEQEEQRKKSLQSLKGEALKEARNAFYAERRTKLKKIFNEEQWNLWSAYWEKRRTANAQNADIKAKEKDSENFSLTKIDRRHWLLTPDGRPFFAHGITHAGNRNAKLNFQKFSEAARSSVSTPTDTVAPNSSVKICPTLLVGITSFPFPTTGQERSQVRRRLRLQGENPFGSRRKSILPD